MRLALALLLCACATPRRVIGQTARFDVEGASVLARIDTGAKRTSVHAVDVVVEGGLVRFTMVGDAGERRALVKPLAGTQTVRNAQGVEERALVPLTLAWGGVTKTVLVNLRDREGMEYRLLIGRDWLEGTAVVDVRKTEPAGLKVPIKSR